MITQKTGSSYWMCSGAFIITQISFQQFHTNGLCANLLFNFRSFFKCSGSSILSQQEAHFDEEQYSNFIEQYLSFVSFCSLKKFTIFSKVCQNNLLSVTSASRIFHDFTFPFQARKENEEFLVNFSLLHTKQCMSRFIFLSLGQSDFHWMFSTNPQVIWVLRDTLSESVMLYTIRSL